MWHKVHAFLEENMEVQRQSQQHSPYIPSETTTEASACVCQSPGLDHTAPGAHFQHVASVTLRSISSPAKKKCCWYTILLVLSHLIMKQRDIVVVSLHVKHTHKLKWESHSAFLVMLRARAALTLALTISLHLYLCLVYLLMRHWKKKTHTNIHIHTNRTTLYSANFKLKLSLYNLFDTTSGFQRRCLTERHRTRTGEYPRTVMVCLKRNKHNNSKQQIKNISVWRPKVYLHPQRVLLQT